MTTKKTPAVNDLLCFSLYSAAQAMNRVYQPLLEQLGLTYPQYIVLVALWREDAQTVGRLGNQLGLESNTLTPLLKRMEAAGLVSRTRSAEDERQVMVTLTERGDGLRSEFASIGACILDATGMSISEASALRDNILMLRDQLIRAKDER